ncbi:hypothetical protein ACW9UR_12010 [Halovulum sp. GXIMD14794]
MRYLLKAACIVAMPATTNAQTTEPDLEMGARLVDARCAFCHTEKSLPELVERCSSVHGEDYLDTFLTDHHAPDEAARADIIAYLTCEAPE